jgi:hypothetical protein
MAMQTRWVDRSHFDEDYGWVEDGYFEDYDDGQPEFTGEESADGVGGDGFGNTGNIGGSDNLGSPDDVGITPPNFVGEETPDHDLTPSEALAGQGWTQDEVGNWYKLDKNGQLTFKDDKGNDYSYNPTKGGFISSLGKLADSSIAKSLGSTLKNFVSDKNGNIDPLKILKLGGAAALTAKSMSSRLGNTSGSAGITGYQGKIPQYTATRHAPPTGSQISGNVTYTPMAKGGSLESGGFVFPADFVSHVGNGSSESGLRILAQRFGATPIKGGGDGMSDSIKTTIDGRQPARVANEEARLTKAQVDAAGGAKKLYAMMDKIREARTGTKKQGKKIDPDKFMPGGIVGYAPGGTVAPAGTIGTESSLSNWAGDYVTDMLAKGKALSDLPFKQYEGKLTADPSALQTKVSTGLQGVNFPGALGASFTNMGAPTAGADGQPSGGGGIASSYMNPYLKNVLDPQLAEMRRNAQINNLTGIGAMTKAGAFGGGRQAIMQSEANQNLLAEQNKTIGQGYSNAYDKGMNQFNTEQKQGMDLVDLMSKQGAVDRGIESENIAAKKARFEEARLNPYKMVQFEQSLLSGLPLESQTFNKASLDGLSTFAKKFTTIDELLKALNQT